MLDVARRRMRPLVPLLLASAMVALPAGCAANGERDDEVRVLEVEDEAFARLGFRRDWVGFPTVSPDARLREMQPAERLILAQDTASILTALDPNTGGIRWQTEPAGRLTKFISLKVDNYQGRPAVLASSETNLYVLEIDTGNLIAREGLARIATGGPVVIGRTAIYGTARGEIMGHALGVAARTWGFDMEGPIESGPVLFGDRIVAAASQAGQVAFLDANSGSLYAGARMFRTSVVPPAVGDRAVYFASTDQSVYAFEPTTGRELWRFRTSQPLRWKPVFWQGSVYVQTADQGFVALDGASGERRWSTPRISGAELIGVTDGRLLVFDGREVYLLSPENGSVLERATLGNIAELEMFPFEDGDLYAMGRGGGVAKLVSRF